MAVIATTGLSLLVGDGGAPENFQPLIGLQLGNLEIHQRTAQSTQVASDAWVNHVEATQRQVMLECQAIASDDAASMRLRSLSLSGAKGNFKLELSASESLQFSAMIIRYREAIEASSIKRIQLRLESTGAATVLV